jgi:hypothetical protein
MGSEMRRARADRQPAGYTQEARTMEGQVSRIRNAHDGKTYIISTCRNPILNLWETAIFEHGGFLRLHGKLVYGTMVVGPQEVDRLLKMTFPRFTVDDLVNPEATIGKPMQFIPVPIVNDHYILKQHNAAAELVQETPPFLIPDVMRGIARKLWHAVLEAGSAPDASATPAS